MERKRDLIISWRYVSLAMNRGAIKQGFTVYNIQLNRLLAFLLIMCIKIIKYEKKNCNTVKSLLFMVFVGRLIHEIKNSTNNETWEAV
jgi:hypothetical protein